MEPERLEREELAALVAERTRELEQELAERRRVEAALRESEVRYRALFENSLDAMLLTTPDGSVLSANPAACRMFGRTEAEIRAMGRACLVDVSDPRLPALLEERARTGRASGELTFIRKDGSTFPGEISSVLFKDPSGAVRTSMLVRDLTERKTAEAQLRRSARNLAVAERIGRTGSWDYDVASDTAAWSENMFRIFDVDPATPRELVFSSFVENRVHPEDRAHVLTVFQDALAGRCEYDLEYRIVRTDGGVRDIHALAETIRDEQGTAIRMIGMVEDITEAKRDAAERVRLTVAIEQAAETVVVTDDRGTIQYVNPMFEVVTGYSRAEAIGRNPRLLKSGEQDVEFYRALWGTISSGRVWRGRLVNRKKDGSLYTEDAAISPVHDQAGHIVNYVAVKHDVTSHIRTAEEKARLADQLRQAQKVEAIGRLAGGVAHDFNNLTAIILGYAELLLGKLPERDPLRRDAEQIVAAGQRAAALTRQLLAFSRKQVLQPEVLDLNALLRGVEEMLGRLIGEHIELHLALAGDTGRITADPGQIQQVVTNLALNARDAMPRGGRLTIETRNVKLDDTYALDHESVAPGSYVMLAMTDTGCGIDPGTMARLFEPFYTTKEKGKGTGLGLATVYGIVKQSGGYIYAYSELGQGMSFKVYLPRTDAAAGQAATEVPGEPPRGAGERLLLVEDEAALRDLCETILVRLGYRVTTARCGAEALLLVRERGYQPDLLVTDVIMPGMSGAELADQLRRELPGLAVLYLSGYPDEAVAHHGVLEPGEFFLQKPFAEREFALKLRETLAGHPRAAPRHLRVLMIDDDEQYRELVRHFCSKQGHDFAGAESEATALAALAAQRFDVFLVDLNIPGTSGERVLREVRAAGHDVPAVVLTGDTASVDREVLRALGAVAILEKSGRSGPLLEALAAAAARRDSPSGGVR